MTAWAKILKKLQNVFIIGDFNMPANSVAFASLFKEYRRAWDDSGAGWGPTFPREWPIVRIDHVLTGPTVDVTSIRTIDPGIGRHQLQVFKVIKRTEVEPGHSNEVLITK